VKAVATALVIWASMDKWESINMSFVVYIPHPHQLLQVNFRSVGLKIN